MRLTMFKLLILLLSMASLIHCTSYVDSNQTTRQGYHTPSGRENQLSLWDGNTNQIWQRLLKTSSARLVALREQTSDPQQKAWLKLALISKKNSKDTKALAEQLLAWQKDNPNHPALSLLPESNRLAQIATTPTPKQIAVMLPQEGPFSAAGQTVREGFLNAYYAQLSKVGEQRVKFYDTSRTQNMSMLYQQAVAEGADMVIGPLVRTDVQQLSNIGSFKSPTLALNYSNSRFGAYPQNYFEFGLLPEDEAVQIANRAHEAGLKNALVIAPQTSWGKRLAFSFATQWGQNGNHIEHTWYYASPKQYADDIEKLPKNIDVIFLFAQPQAARTIVPLLKRNFSETKPIYATSSVYAGIPDPSKDQNLNGIIICDLPWNMHLAKETLTNAASKSNRLYAVGQDAYLLSQSISRLQTLPNFPIYGSTGALTLSATHQIHRSIPCNKMTNGLL